MRRLYCLAVILLVVATLGFSQTLNYGTFKPTKQITISIETDLSGPPTKPPTEDVVTPILRQKTGVTAVPYPTPPNLGNTAGLRVQAQIAGNNLPDLYTESYTPPQVDGQQALIDMDMAWDFNDKAFLKKMFPNFSTRLEPVRQLRRLVRQRGHLQRDAHPDHLEHPDAGADQAECRPEGQHVVPEERPQLRPVRQVRCVTTY